MLTLTPSSSHFTSTPNTPVLHSMQPSHSHTPTHFTLTPHPHSTPSHITPSLTMRESHILLCDVLQFVPAPPLDPGEGVSHPQHWVTPLSAKGNSIALYREGGRGKKGGRGEGGRREGGGRGGKKGGRGRGGRREGGREGERGKKGGRGRGGRREGGDQGE